MYLTYNKMDPSDNTESLRLEVVNFFPAWASGSPTCKRLIDMQHGY